MKVSRKELWSKMRVPGFKKPQITKWLLDSYGVGCDPMPDAFYLTHCSRQKSKRKQGTPVHIYASNRVQLFSSRCVAKPVRYGILSDEYGIVLSDQIIPNYDTPPSTLSDADLHKIGDLVGKQSIEAGIKAIHYVTGGSYLMSIPYMIILMASGVPFTLSPDFPKKKIGFK